MNKCPVNQEILIILKPTKKTSSNIGVRAELGRLPMEHFIMTQSILYLARLHSDHVNALLKEALMRMSFW
jgi:hypothetical protein